MGISSGGITYIDDPSVRRLISQYADRVDRQVVAQEDLVGQWQGPMVQYYQAHASLYDMIGAVSWPYEGLPLDVGSFDFDVEAFVGNRDFANLLAHRSILIGLARGATNELLQAIDALSEKLEEAV